MPLTRTFATALICILTLAPAPALFAAAPAPSAKAAPSQPAGFEILSATWGLNNKTIDVTALLKEKIAHGDRSIAVHYSTLGDPVPNQTKTLTLTYRLNGQQYTTKLKGGTTLNFADLMSPPKTLPLDAIEIVEAHWGLDDTFIDVTDKLRDAISSGADTLEVTYQNLGDPVPKKLKQLKIKLRAQGKLYERTINEKTSLELSDLGNLNSLTPSGPPGSPSALAYNGPTGPWSTLQLTSQDPRESSNGSTIGSLLVRELERQAILIAARDELGVSTRDMAMGERFQKDDRKIATLLMGSQNWVGGEMQIFLDSPGGPGATDPASYAKIDLTDYSNKSPGNVLFRERIPIKKEPLLDYAWIVTEMEARSRLQFAAALKKAGFTSAAPAPVRWVATAPPPADVLKDLRTMDPLSQFIALRKIHQQMRTAGTSSELLEALVRGYGNLGFMTQPLLSGMYKTYFARSLLYAERLVAHYPNNAHALDVRAYARGITGLAKLSLDDLAAAKKLSPSSPPPAWAPVLDAYAHFDLPAMNSLATKPGDAQSLAQMLTVAIAHDGFSQRQLIELGTTALRQQTDNLWLMQTLFSEGQLGTVGTMSRQMLTSLPAMLAAKSSDFGAPRPADIHAPAIRAQDTATRYSAFEEACKNLDQQAATDPDEPSLAALGALLRDEEFLAVYHYGDYLHSYIGAGKDQVGAFLRDSSPAWHNHPLAGLIEMLLNDPAENHQAWRAAVDKIDPIDGGAWYEHEVMAKLQGADYDAKWPLWLQAQAHGDLIPFDQTEGSLTSPRLDKDHFLDELRANSPYAALPMWAWMSNQPLAARVFAPAPALKILDDVRTHFADRTNMVQISAAWYESLKDRKSAIKILADLQTRDPSVETATALLGLYAASNDIDKAVSLVDSALELPSAGLEDASLAEHLAYVLMARNDYAGALKYASRAADSGASWGMTCLANCLDRLGQPDKVEPLLRAMSERYDTDELRWYAWSKRLNRPDTAAARQAAEKRMALQPDAVFSNAHFYLVEHNPAKALEVYKAHPEALTNPHDLMFWATTAAEAHDEAQIDFALKKALDTQTGPQFPIVVTIDRIRSNDDVEDAVTRFELTIGPALNDDNNIDASLVARFLAATGHKPQALRLLTRLIRSPWSTNETYLLVWQALKDLGEDPDKLVAAAARKVDLARLLGTWRATNGTDNTQWTLDKDGTVETPAGLRGEWWEDSDRIMIAWRTGDWAVFSIPLNDPVLQGQSSRGPATMRKQP